MDAEGTIDSNSEWIKHNWRNAPDTAKREFENAYLYLVKMPAASTATSTFPLMLASTRKRSFRISG